MSTAIRVCCTDQAQVRVFAPVQVREGFAAVQDHDRLLFGDRERSWALYQ